MDLETISITLPADVAKRVRDRVAAGDYATDSDVVQDALQHLDVRDHDHEAELARVRLELAAAAQSTRWITDEEVGANIEAWYQEAVKKRA